MHSAALHLATLGDSDFQMVFRTMISRFGLTLDAIGVLHTGFWAASLLISRVLPVELIASSASTKPLPTWLRIPHPTPLSHVVELLFPPRRNDPFPSVCSLYLPSRDSSSVGLRSVFLTPCLVTNTFLDVSPAGSLSSPSHVLFDAHHSNLATSLDIRQSNCLTAMPHQCSKREN